VPSACPSGKAHAGIDAVVANRGWCSPGAPPLWWGDVSSSSLGL